MPTSSILYDFTISGAENANRFARALELAEQQPQWQPHSPASRIVSDHEEIRAIMAKSNYTTNNKTLIL